MDATARLKAELYDWTWLKDRLVREEDFDAVELMSAMESETNIQECLLEIAESAIEDEHSVTAVKARVKELQERASRLELRAEKKRRVVFATMQNLDLKTVTGPNATLSMRQGGRELVVTDEKQIPEQYWTPQPPKLNKRQLRDDLELGFVSGAQLSNGGGSCVIRVK